MKKLRIKTLKALRKVFRQGGVIREHAATFFTEGKNSELLFREDFQRLLPDSLSIIKASIYTECDKEFSGEDRPAKAPTDYEIVYKNMVIAAIDVTRGVKGYSYVSSKVLDINEDKLERMDRYLRGYVVMLVLVGEPRFIWVTSSDIRTSPVHINERGESTLRSNPKIWSKELNSLVAVLVKLSEHVDELLKAV